MKKLTALLLALCMLLAVVPALGEDFSGTWYMVLEDVTVGTLRKHLKEKKHLLKAVAGVFRRKK